MKFTKRSIATILCFALLMPAPAAEPSFKVGPGDVLEINTPILGSLADLSRLSMSLPIVVTGESVFFLHRVIVSPDGTISVAGISDPIPVNGATLAEIQSLVASKLRLRSGQVFVSLDRTDRDAYQVWGEVKQSGRFKLEHPTFLHEGLSYAGGPVRGANLAKVLLIRASGERAIFDLRPRIIEKKGFPPLQLKASDTIIVPKNWVPDSTVVFMILMLISTATAVYAVRK